MSVTSVSQLTFMQRSAQDMQHVKETLYFQVVCSALTDGAPAARQAAGVPQPGTVLNWSTYCFVHQVTAQPMEQSSLVFLVEVVAQTPKNNQKKNANPLNRPTNITFDGVAVREQVQEDINNNPIVNSAGAPYDPSLERIYYDESITIDVNLASVDTATYSTYRGAINSDTITMTLPDGSTRIFDPFTLRCAKVSAEMTYENGVQFWKCRFELLCRDRTLGTQTIDWNPLVIDRGFEHLINGVPAPNKGPDGQRLQSAQLLDGNGNLLKPPAAPVLLTFNVDPQLPFATILTF